MNNSRKKINQWFLLINNDKGRLQVHPSNCRNKNHPDSSKTEIKVTKPKGVCHWNFSQNTLWTLKAKEMHIAVVGALKQVLFSFCIHKRQVYFLFLSWNTSRIKFRPPIPNTISKQNRTKPILKPVCKLRHPWWKTLCLPSFAWYVNIKCLM